MLSKKCKLHLEEVGETRWQHFKHAMWVSWQLEKAAYACFLHAFAHQDGFNLMQVISVKKC